MAKPLIQFFIEGIDFTLKQKQKHKDWLLLVAKSESFEIKELNYIFSTDEFILKINQDFLDHDTLTDIITFDNSLEKGKIEGEIYISIERVKENASIEKTNFETELNRVMVHGLLHLCSYKDKTVDEQNLMRKKEDEALKLVF
jgi:probable rRNA maturation factor